MEEKVRISSKISIFLLALAVGGIGVSHAADEDGFDSSKATLAYTDGYVGTDNQFHAWEHRSDAEDFRAHHMDQYRPWRHDDPLHHDNH